MKRTIAIICSLLAVAATAETLSFPAKLRRGATRNAQGNVEVKGVWQNFIDLTVQPRQRYRVTVTARIKAGPSLENTPAMENMMPQMVWGGKSFPWKLPAITYEYRGKNRVRAILYHNTKAIVFSSKFREYKFDIYTLDEVDTLRFFVRANAPGNTVEVSKAEFVKVDMSKEKYLNANADFELGDYNPGGFGYAHQGVYGKDEKGWYIDLGHSWAVCDAIPVKAGDKLKVSFAGEPAPQRNFIKFGVTFFDNPQFNLKKGRIGSNKWPMRLKKGQNSGSAEVIVPAGASWMRSSFSNGTMRYIKIEKISGDK